MARYCLIVLIGVATIAVSADASEIVVQNDDGSLGNPQEDFLAARAANCR